MICRSKRSTVLTVFIKDVAHVRDGFSVQTNVVHGAGRRGVLLSIYKSGNASTLEVVKRSKRRCRRLPPPFPLN